MSSRIKLSDVLRMDEALLERIRVDQDPRAVMALCCVVIAVGCGAYGFSLGMWRSDMQAVFAAVKLPAMMFACVLLTAALDVVLCGLLRAKVSGRQALLCSLLAMASMAAILGALAPVSAWFVMHAPAPDGDATLAVAQWLLIAHVLVLATAGVVGVRQLYGALGKLVPNPAIARRVLWAWLLSHGVVGAQLSWIMRPFVGKPGLPVTFFRADAWDGTFFESVWVMAETLMGPGGPVMALIWVGLLGAGVALTLSHRPITHFCVNDDSVAMWHRTDAPAETIPLTAVRGFERLGREVVLTVADEESLVERVVRLLCDDVAAASQTYEQLAWAHRARCGGSPFRASSRQTPPRTPTPERI